MTLGSVDISSRPNDSGDKLDKSQVFRGELVKSREDSAKVFNFIEETLNEMTFFRAGFVVVSLMDSVFLWGDNRLYPRFS